MKVTRYLWISHLPRHCQEHHIHTTFQSHGKIQTIRIHENNNRRGAIVAFIDCKSSTKALESVKILMKIPLKLEYCEANGEPGITNLGLTSEGFSGDNKISRRSGSNKTSNSRSGSTSSNTSSFGSSLDDCAKYPPLQVQKRAECAEGRSCSEESGEKRRGPESAEGPEGEEGQCGLGVTEGLEGEQRLHEDMRGLLVENLSQRSSDTSLREGLFHEYKKHGKITSVAVMGQGGARHAVISFKRPEDMTKALEASASKTFFGQLIKVKQHHGYNYVDPDLCPPEHAMDEYHPKATKTLFVGKLCTGSVLEQDLAKVFRKYGEIIDIDIKTQSNQPDTSFAFVQYFDISSVVRALRCQDSIKIDGKSVKLGFGKSQPANCLWVGNLQRSANDTFLRRHFKRYGAVMLVIPDQEYNCALVQFEAAEDALRAFTDTRERSNTVAAVRRMQVDYASNEYQMAFMNRLRKSCQLDTQDFLKNITDPYQTEKIQNLLISYTKYLGLLDETRTRSYDRYETKSDYDDYDDFYSSHPTRQRKSVHQRLYNDSYGVDDEYSDDYHYSKPKTRPFDEYSSSRSPVRYSRNSQKYISDQYGPQDSRRANYQHYPNDYYEPKVEPSSSTYYPYRRSPDPNYTHSNHNRSFSPSPTSSVDYCDDYPRYNLSPKRYSKSNKEYHISRSRQLDVHDTVEGRFEQTPETKNRSKPLRRNFDGDYTAFNSKSKSKPSASLSPHVKNSSVHVRSVKNEPIKKTRIRRINNNDDSTQQSSICKVVQTTNNTTIKTMSSNIKTKASGNSLVTNAPSTDTVKPPTEIGSVPSVVQPVDALSKLERERAKLLEELSLLSEDTSGTLTNIVIKPVKTSPKELHDETIKFQKKRMSPPECDKGPPSKSSSSLAVTEKRTVKIEKVVVKVEPKVLDNKLKVKEIPEEDKRSELKISTPTSLTLLNPSVNELRKSCTNIYKNITDGELNTPKTDISVTDATTAITTSSTLQPLDFSNLSRDPRLNSSTYNVRPFSSSSISPTNLVLPLMSTVVVSESVVTTLPTSCSYKDSTSDSDIDPFSNIDFDVDKRIRELDAKMSRSEQTVRILDYSKFRIRKKDSGSLSCVTTTVSVHSSPSYLIVSPSSSMVSSSSLLDVGYSNTNRDLSSNTSEFIKSMLNKTKPTKSYHLLSDNTSDHMSSLCSNYSIVSTTCSSLPFRTVDLGANDMERRTLFSRFGTSTPSSLPFADSKLNVDTSMLSPTFSSYISRHATTTITTTTSLKVSTSSVVSPTTTVSTVSAPNTPNGVDSNQPMKSILKKSNPSNNSLTKLTNKPDTTVTLKIKASQDSISSADSINTKSNDLKEALPKKLSNVNRKRKSEDDDVKKQFKKTKNDNGPVLDDTLFQSYPTMPTKKVKKSVKKSIQPQIDVKPTVLKKVSLSPNASTSEKHITKKIEIQNNKKLSKTYTEKQKSKLSANKKSKLKSKSASNLKQIRNGKSKSNKIEKTKKITKCKKERVCYESRFSDDKNDDELEEDMEDFSDNEENNDSESSDSDDYESMYDKIKRRKNKFNKMNEESKRKQAFGKRRRNNNNGSEFADMSLDNLDSEDSEYWSVKSNKRSSHQKRKRVRVSDLSSTHFSDSNSCKTVTCGKFQELENLSDKHDTKCGMKTGEDNIKDESVTDESKAPAESFNLSSPHNSSQCSSPKYIKEMPNVKGIIVSGSTSDVVTLQGVQTVRGRSLHRPNDGPLKKRPITEPIVLSEDLPFLEKQAEEEYMVSSPTSFNDEPPSQLESMYDLPSGQQTNVLEEIVIDDHHHSSDVVDAEYIIQETMDCDVLDQDESVLPADVDSASHILLTMKSQPALEVEYVSTVINEPDHQLQSVAEHLISLAQNSVECHSNVPCEPLLSVSEEEKVESSIQIIDSRRSKTPPSIKQDDEVTIYVKNIIDRIKQETDLASSLKERIAKRAKKNNNTFNIPLSKPMMVNNVSQECRHMLPLVNDTTGRLASATITTTQPFSLGTVSSACVMITNNQGADQTIHYPKSQSSKSSQGEEKRSIHSDEANSSCSTEKRMRHNSAKSDGQLQSLDETIDNVLKGSISSSASDALSIKSITDIDESKSLSNSYESINIIKGDLSNLEETMNEVISKVNVPSPSASVTSHVSLELDCQKFNINTVRPMFNNDINKQKKITMNHVKPSVYQLTNNVGGITNLVLGIPSILTLVSQQNALNHMVSFQNSVSGQNKLSNQLTLPLNKVAASSLHCNVTSSGSSQVIPSLSLTPANINIQSNQQHIQNSNIGVQSTEMVFTKLNSLTPIMIQAPLRNIASLGQNNNMLTQSVISNRSSGNTVNATLVSIAAGLPACNISTDTSSGKLISVSLTPSINKPITTPINVIPRTSLTSHGLNLAKISTASLDPSYYLMMQRQTNQSKSKCANICQSSSSDVNVSGLNHISGHSIILSQLTHSNSVLSPITPGYLAGSISRSSTNSVTLQPLTASNGIVTTAPASSILFRPLNIPFRKFEEKDDWLKQNAQSEFNYPIRWTGKLCLKNDEVFVQMHMLAGNEDLIRNSMNLISSGQDSSQPLRIVQRMRLEPNQLEGLQRRLARQLEFCTCLTLAGGDKPDELGRTSSALKDNFINYLREKSAAGIINICVPDSQQNAYVIHIFPPCDFSDNQLRTCSNKLYEQLKEQEVPYLVIVITTV